MNYSSLAEQVKQYALAFFNMPENQHLYYHNLVHTEGVVKAAVQIGNHYQLGDQDFFIVLAAAWFHDTGYFSGPAANHEQRGADKAAAYLNEQGVDAATIGKVQACILATKLPQSPVTLVEQIVCDADLFHLGTDEFQERNKLMRKECSTIDNNAGKEEWRKSSIKLLQSHHYHTAYCKELLNEKKQENLDKLMQKQQEVTEKKAAVPVVVAPPAQESIVPAVVPVSGNAPVSPAVEYMVPVYEKKKKKKDKDKGDRPDKGIETMFRVASTNHQRLSDMSDNKAHIMISVNSIIISVIIGLVVRKMDGTSLNIMIPTLILLTGSMFAIVFAVLATRPKIPDGTFTKSQVDDKTVNLLFFGNFYKMDFGDYYDGMKKVMEDREFLYGSLIKDIYSQGKVLGRKYKLLRISYTVFMFTLILSIFAFGIATLFFL